jgi:hypothetical protein
MVGSSIYAGDGLLASGGRLQLLLMILILLLILLAGTASIQRIMIRIRSMNRID